MSEPHPPGEAPDTAPIEVTYYTDPLCAWSWAFEPQWRRLRYEFGSQVRWRYRMGGLIPSWEAFTDPLNDVSRPIQLGPLWVQVRHTSGMPLDDRLWFADPPASSYPACLAVKAAGLQSPWAAELYLRRTREAVMTDARNIARRDVLEALADEVAGASPGVLDPERLRRDLDGEEARAAFRDDLMEARYRRIERFPALTVRRGERGVVLVGYRPYPALLDALLRVAPDVPRRQVPDAQAYAAYWGSVLPAELAEALKGQATPPQPAC
ncbi:DsbA family protein [Deinococcus aluminii]|uniref:UPF0413 protein YjbH n=1 Tax=Deinococcus aluminii TaxID=1656885 RepID=A0ABP9XCB0_9DEIO